MRLYSYVMTILTFGLELRHVEKSLRGNLKERKNSETKIDAFFSYGRLKTHHEKEALHASNMASTGGGVAHSVLRKLYNNTIKSFYVAWARVSVSNSVHCMHRPQHYSLSKVSPLPPSDHEWLAHQFLSILQQAGRRDKLEEGRVNEMLVRHFGKGKVNDLSFLRNTRLSLHRHT